MKKTVFFSVLILLGFLIAGLCIYDDFGVTLDEPNQIIAGHVIYKYLCTRFGREVPEAIKDVPELYSYRNRYYGQASTFPTVIIEAVRGFAMDSSTIIRFRHLWNFLTYFAGLCCFAATISRVYHSHLKSGLALLLLIFLPRIYGDIFYNDRDTMLLAWFMISISAFYWYKLHPCFFRGLICAFCFGITYNVRLFGLLLIVFPVVFFRSSKSRKGDILIAVASFLVFFLVSPIYWENPLHSIPAAFFHMSETQRSLDSNHAAVSQFFGKMVSEDHLPWYYIPVYIFITTPLVTSLLFLLGCYCFGKKIFRSKKSERDPGFLIGIGMLIILFPFMLTVVLFRPSLYNGWRHFYFLYLPIIWLSLEGTGMFFDRQKKAARITGFVLLGCSFFCSAVWMFISHPYYYVYLNPAFRKEWSGKFTKDYWCLAATDAMKYLLNNVESYAIHIVDHDMVKVNQMGLSPAERDRFHTYRFSVQPYPIEYEYIQYSEYNDGLQEEISIGYYSPYYIIKRDDNLLAEVFQRTHNYEYQGSEVLENITVSLNDDPAEFAADGDFNTVWENPGGSVDILMKLKPGFQLTDIEIFPELNNYEKFPDFLLYSSSDGISWNALTCDRKGANGLSFSPVKDSWLKIQTDPEITGIRDILFHGNFSDTEK